MTAAAILLRGAIHVGVGVLAFALPLALVSVLVVIGGALAVVHGVYTLLAARRMQRGDLRRRPLCVAGGLALLVGVLALVAPVGAATVLMLLLAVAVGAAGLAEFAVAARVRRVLPGAWVFGAAGGVLAVFALVLLIAPQAGLVALVWLLGAYALASGVGLITQGLRLRRRTLVLPPSR